MDRIMSLIGLAYKANKITYGFKAMEAIKSKKAYLVLLADDTANNTKKKVLDKCAFYQVPVKSVSSRFNLSKAIGKANIVMIAIMEEGFAKSINQA